MRGEYAEDEVLEEIYISHTESDNWKSAAQDLFNLFASSGTGVLLRSRTLECRTDGQRAWLEEAAQNECAVQLSCQEKARQTLSEQVIAFMRGTKPSCVLIYGPEAMGKATIACAMADEFPGAEANTGMPHERRGDTQFVCVPWRAAAQVHAAYGKRGYIFARVARAAE